MENHKDFVRMEVVIWGVRHQVTIRIDYKRIAMAMVNRAAQSTSRRATMAFGGVILHREFVLESDNAPVPFTRIGK